MFQYRVELLQLDPPDLFTSPVTTDKGGSALIQIALYFTQRGARCRCDGAVPSQFTVQSFLPSDLLILQLEVKGKAAGLQPPLPHSDSNPYRDCLHDQLDGAVTIGFPSRDVGACWVPLREVGVTSLKPTSTRASSTSPRVYILWAVNPIPAVGNLRPSEKKREDEFVEESATRKDGFMSPSLSPILLAHRIANQVESAPDVSSNGSSSPVVVKREIEKPAAVKQSPPHHIKSPKEVEGDAKRVQAAVSDSSKLIVSAASASLLKPLLRGANMQVDVTPKTLLHSPSPQWPDSPTKQGGVCPPHYERDMKEKKNHNPPGLDSIRSPKVAPDSSLLSTIVDDNSGNDRNKEFCLKSRELEKQEFSERQLDGDFLYVSNNSNIIIGKTDSTTAEGGNKASSVNTSIPALHSTEVDAFRDKEIHLYPARREKKLEYPNSDNLKEDEKVQGKRGILDYYATSTQGPLAIDGAYLNLYLTPSPSLLEKYNAQSWFTHPREKSSAKFGIKCYDLANIAKDFALKRLDDSALASIRRERREQGEDQKGSVSGEGGLLPREHGKKDAVAVSNTAENESGNAIPGENAGKFIDLDYFHQSQEVMINQHKFHVFGATEKKRVQFSRVR